MRLTRISFLEGSNFSQRNQSGVIKVFGQQRQITRQRISSQVSQNVQNPVTLHGQLRFQLVNARLTQL